MIASREAFPLDDAPPARPPILRPVGAALLALGTMGHAIIGLASGRLPVQLFGAWLTPVAIAAISAMVVIACVGVLARPASTGFWIALAGFWAIALASASASAMAVGGTLIDLVPVVESLLLAAACLQAARPRRADATPILGESLTIVPAVTLLIFGVVHLHHAASVATLIPAWIPQANAWPYLTGSVMLAAAFAAATHLRRPALLLVALMFATWLPLVHAERLAIDPSSPFEWSFALMAVALTGALVLAAEAGTQAAATKTRTGSGPGTPAAELEGRLR